jgi:hypothetical protein
MWFIWGRLGDSKTSPPYLDIFTYAHLTGNKTKHYLIPSPFPTKKKYNYCSVCLLNINHLFSISRPLCNICLEVEFRTMTHSTCTVLSLFPCVSLVYIDIFHLAYCCCWISRKIFLLLERSSVGLISRLWLFIERFQKSVSFRTVFPHVCIFYNDHYDLFQYMGMPPFDDWEIISMKRELYEYRNTGSIIV